MLVQLKTSHYNRRRATLVRKLIWTRTWETRCQIKAHTFGPHFKHFQPETAFTAISPDCCLDVSLISAMTLHLPELQCALGNESNAGRWVSHCSRWPYLCFDLTLFGQNGNTWQRGSINGSKCSQDIRAKRTHQFNLAVLMAFISSMNSKMTWN